MFQLHTCLMGCNPGMTGLLSLESNLCEEEEEEEEEERKEEEKVEESV